MTSRRDFLAIGGLATAALATRLAAQVAPVRPARLKPGDTIGLINPAGAT